MFRSASLFIGTSFTVAVFTIFATSNLCRLDCRYSPQNIFNAKNFNPHKKPISLLNVPICTQSMQRTWWQEAGTVIVTGPYSLTNLQNKIRNLLDRSTTFPKFIYAKEGKLAEPTQVLSVRVHGWAVILKTAAPILPNSITKRCEFAILLGSPTSYRLPPPSAPPNQNHSCANSKLLSLVPTILSKWFKMASMEEASNRVFILPSKSNSCREQWS